MQAEELIELVSKTGRSDTMKVSRRDLGYITGLVMLRESVGNNASTHTIL